MNEWSALARDLAWTLTRSTTRADPICFVLGAGTSLTSNAPSTSAVVERFDRAFAGRFSDADDEERRRLMDQVNEHDKRAAIADLFEGPIVPYVGYRCLAAMGRQRRVVVLNLNWDTAVEDACERLSIPCEAIDVQEEERLEAALTADGPGVVCVHLHGIWGGERRLRYGRLETLSFSDGQQRLLAEHALRHTTVIAGASLRGDLNVEQFFDRLPGRSTPGPDIRGLWIFMRGDGPVGATRATIDRALGARDSAQNWVAGGDVDFDRLLVTLREAERNADSEGSVEPFDYEALRRKAVGVALPDFDSMIWPKPNLLRNLLDEPVVALVGEARLGKTTVAHLLAFWRALWSSEGGVQTLRGTSSAPAAVATAVRAPGATHEQLVIEDPYGQEDVDDNPAFPQALQQLVDGDVATGVVITSRLRNWHAGYDGNDTSPLPEHAVVESDPASWWAEPDLLRYLDRHGEATPNAREAIRERQLNTPSRIDALLVGFPPRADDPGNVRDKHGMLDALLSSNVEDDVGTALTIVLARLQEVAEQPLTEEAIVAPLGSSVDLPKWKQASSMLFAFEMDGVRRRKLMHATDREAVDLLLRERRTEIQKAISGLGRRSAWALVALDVLDALKDARHASDWSLDDVPSTVRATWAGELVVESFHHSVTRGWHTIDGLLDDAHVDFWALCDIAYEAQRLWDTLSEDRDAVRNLVQRVLADRDRLGAYAMLEAALYLQRVDQHDLWGRIRREIFHLADEAVDEFELGLIFDGLVWRPPAVAEDVRRELFDALLVAAEHRPALVGAYALACEYHRSGANFLAEHPDLDDPSENLRELSADQAAQAARVIRFHFAHQARARAALARRPFEGGTIEFLFQTTYPEPLERDHADRLLTMAQRVGAHAPHAGWAVHLLLNVGNTQGKFSDDQLRQAVALLPNSVDDGVLAGAIAHQANGDLDDALRAWFAEDADRVDATLDRLRDGFECDGWNVRPPRYHFVRDLTELWTLLGCDWPQLNRLAEVSTADPIELVASYETVAEQAAEKDGVDRSDVIAIIDQMKCGDLRSVERAAAARDGEDPHLRNLTMAARARRDARENPSGLF